MAILGTAERPLRVAIVGSGPSGFYAADPLLKAEVVCQVDMYDRLPTPFGLVRGGVAPDHPKIRTVTRVYEKIADHERFSFLGNVMIGRDISLEELRRFYDAVLFACGAETDRRLGIPGEDLSGSHTATSFVGWYNAHPDYRHLTFDLSHEVAVVIGVGNVAMDVARVLSKTVDELRHTDIAQHALDVLAESKIREVHVIGRRGAAQAAFTPAELKEMGELETCGPAVRAEELVLDPVSEQEAQIDRNKLRNLELLREFAGREAGAKPKRSVFRFLLSPIEIRGGVRVESLIFEKNKLVGDTPFKLKALGTTETEELACGLIFRSIGYRGIPIPGVPFHDSWGLFPNVEGRITEDGQVAPGLYAAGWIKRGPSGSIGTNKPDSLETVKHLLDDVPHLTPCAEPSTEAVLRLLQERGVQVVSIEGWRRIDAAEAERGKAYQKPRERFTRIEEMLEVLGG
ncbi:MAG: FAD-dependent oxidoreductase [Candidatus Hydrogenedentes bacterium]|nr:FAD-dependent oxidoreductase [Candidatus Hydrogenedentota bacterium]